VGRIAQERTQGVPGISDQIAASGGDSVSLTYADLMHDFHCGAPAPSLRLLRYLRLIEMSSGKSLAGTYRLNDGWRELDENQVGRLMAAAREVRPREAAWRRMAELGPD
jgi:hypothetical protein